MNDSTLLPLLDAAVRGAAIALLLLLALALHRLPLLVATVMPGRLLALGMVVQLVGGTPALDRSLSLAAQSPMIAVSVGNGALFWLTVRGLFDDGFRPAARDALAWVLVVVASLAACLLTPAPWPSAWSVAAAIQRAAPLVFALLSLAAAVRQWDADLVETRRKLRAFLVVTGIAYTLTMLAVRLTGGPRLGPVAAIADALAVLAIVAPLTVWAIRRAGSSDDPARPVPLRPPMAGDATGAGEPTDRAAHPSTAMAGAAAPALAVDLTAGIPALDGSSLDPAIDSGTDPTTDATADATAGSTPDATTDPATDPADDRLATALAHAMDHQQAWRDEELSIGRLADRLDAPEYRLRRVINRRLGHRNFNAFVNGYRLEAACRALADPAQREQPVLTIALDAGFSSIGPFNRAFRQATGVTPTEYRRARLSDAP